MNEKKGLSTVVTTLIIVLLVLAAIGIIWGPIRGLLSSSTDSLSQTACLDLDLRATKVTNITANTYNVTIRKQGGSTDLEVGAMLIFYSDAGTSDTVKFGPLFGESTQVRTAGPITGVANANKVEVIPYLINPDTAEEMVCSTSTEFSFTL